MQEVTTVTDAIEIAPVLQVREGVKKKGNGTATIDATVIVTVTGTASVTATATVIVTGTGTGTARRGGEIVGEVGMMTGGTREADQNLRTRRR